MPSRATGPFDVTMTPQPPHDPADPALPGRFTLDKHYHGDLEGPSRGQMLAVRTATPGSAGYVAMETFRGTFLGRRGSFVLQHSSTMERGTPSQSIVVVPDSGTEELVGLTGRMMIVMEGKAHRYEFDYTLPG